ncbi:FadR/GntR family transcriptional regulator [Desulfogranum marinum]|uniref:FadR/GntR family transcriptional regulator n=1 Tax=Desulfogranum marinum TaxID=453220 RepID=UPI001966774A|nr:FadR/GntR family transcriptional regulator [Desulfogranum marinum]MBM9513898.1 FadR family transcriptional regulator [Desulfogranum marinum]
MNLRPIKPKRISDQVFEQIRELIYRGELKPGEQLLPERELASSLEVSRTTVRNAINKLVTLGLLEHRQGQGTFVTIPNGNQGNPLATILAVDDVTIHDLLEVRLGLECNAARMAASRAMPQDILNLAKANKEMAETVETGALGNEADAAFHMAISFATKNPVQIHLMRNFYDLLFLGIKKNLSHLWDDPENIDIVLAAHSKIYEAIANKQPDAAEAAMREHIEYVQEWFRKRW